MIAIPLIKFHALPLVLLVSLILHQSSKVNSLENGLAKTPPMGWISWVRFTCDTDCSGANEDSCISYRLYNRTAHAMKAKGFDKVGYEYVNIDDCWSELERDANRALIPHKERFNGADGIKSLVEELQKLGLKLGIYGDCGTKTCANYPAQLSQNDSLDDNFYDIDAKTFFDWGVESFKFDGCYITPGKSEDICPGMSKALQAAQDKRKPILLTCEWPYYMMSTRHVEKPLPVDWKLVKKSCNLWRHYEDIYDSWLSVTSIIDYSVGMQDEILRHHGPGAWFDPDQLVIGGFGLSHDQARVHMVIWSLWSAPLFMSNDVEKLSQRDIDLLQNQELIAINQDKMGIWGQMVLEKEDAHWSTGILQVFVKPLMPKVLDQECPDFAIAYFYRGSLGHPIKWSLKIKDILQKSKSIIEEASKRRSLKDASLCLERIQQTKFESKPINGYSVLDPLDDYEANQTLTLEDDLTLLVNPTGIRVVKLTQTENNPETTTIAPS